MQRFVYALILSASSVLAQDAPVVPVATIDAPASVPPGSRLVLLPGEGFKSKGPPAWKVISPKGTIVRVEGNALIVRETVPGVIYKFSQVATGDNPPFDFDFAEVVVESPKPAPTPVIPKPIVPTPAPSPAPSPVTPTPSPTPSVDDTLGISAAIHQVVSGGQYSPVQLDGIAGIFDYLASNPKHTDIIFPESFRDMLPTGFAFYDQVRSATQGQSLSDAELSRVYASVAATIRGGKPTPTPSPAPVPTPQPTPSPDGSLVGNMRVVILYESAGGLNREQRNAVYSTRKVIPYLNLHCLKDTSGRPSWRMWDRNAKVQFEPPEWQDAFAKAATDATPIPKVVIFAGNTVVASRAISTEDDLLAFLQSKGGK